MNPLFIAGTTLGMAGLNVFGANQKNKALQEAIDSQRASTELRNSQIRLATRQQRGDLFRRSRQILGQIVNNAGEAGLALDGTVATIAAQAAADTYRADTAILTNDQSQIDASNSEYYSRAQSARNQYSNPFVAGIRGAVQGLQLGMSLNSAYDSFTQASDAASQAARQTPYLARAGGVY